MSRLLSQDQYQIAIRVITFLYHSVDAFHSSQRVEVYNIYYSFIYYNINSYYLI